MMEINRVTVDDARELLEIYAPYVMETAISLEYEVPSIEEFQHRIKTISSRLPYIKAVDDHNRIIGYAYAGSFKTRKGYDWSVETTVYVKREFRNRGVGKQLYEVLEQSLRDIGILNMNACIVVPREVDEHLTMDSIRFHEKMGFSLVGTFHQSGYKLNAWHDVTWMEKLLAPHQVNQSPVRFGDWQISQEKGQES